MLTHLIAIIAAAASAQAATYPLAESWSGDNFFSGWRSDPSLFDNTTNGDVFWARVSNQSIYSVQNGRAILRVDNTSFVPYNEKRNAPKLLSRTAYSVGTVWIMDAVHVPYGCSVWPAFWTQGANWPAGGEIDILEGVNQQIGNQVAVHASGQCTATPGGTTTGTLTQNNCQVGLNGDSGCIFKDNNANSYGEAFAAAGGGVYIAELATEGIRVWFFTRASVPSSLSVSAQTIDTGSLGTPVAWYSSSTCNISQFFGPQTLTLTTTLCGDWAGTQSVLESTCGALVGTNTCYTEYVIDDAAATYRNAYFEINYVNVYSTSSASGNASTGASASGSASRPSNSASRTGDQNAAAASSSRAAGYQRWEGPGFGWVVLVGVAMVGAISTLV